MLLEAISHADRGKDSSASGGRVRTRLVGCCFVIYFFQVAFRNKKKKKKGGEEDVRYPISFWVLG